MVFMTSANGDGKFDPGSNGVNIDLVSQSINEASEVISQFGSAVVMFSGGRDSTAAMLVALEASRKTDIPLRVVFVDTGVATPGLRDYVVNVTRMLGVELEIVGPKYDYFDLVLAKGFPTITRRWCKEFLKLRPFKEWLKHYMESDIGDEPIVITGVRKDESWMKSRSSKLVRNPRFYNVMVYAPILEWSKIEVEYLIKLYNVPENPLYHTYGKAYDCWCSVYKTPADFALLAKNHPEFFKRFVETEKKLRSGGSALFVNGRRIYLREIAENPDEYLEQYRPSRSCPLCRTMLHSV